MTTQSNYTAEEWSLLRVAPFLAGITVMRVGSSGLHSLNEIAVIFKSILAGGESYPDSELVRLLSDKEEASKGEDQFGEMIKGMKPAEVQAFTVEQLKTVKGILDAKADNDEAETYKQWMMDIGLNVAKAAKEGGHFGFGGVQISDPEKEALRVFASALGTEIPPEAVS